MKIVFLRRWIARAYLFVCSYKHPALYAELSILPFCIPTQGMATHEKMNITYTISKNEWHTVSSKKT